jgi:hypothetical protein
VRKGPHRAPLSGSYQPQESGGYAFAISSRT